MPGRCASSLRTCDPRGAESVGIEEVAAVSGQAHVLVDDTAVNRAEGRQQSAPRRRATLKHVGAGVRSASARSVALSGESA
jgi:hypothetical protein